MSRAQSVIALSLLFAAVSPSQMVPEEYSRAGERAYELTGKMVAIGPRPAGSANQAKQRRLIVERLQRAGCDPQQIGFQARTPTGPVAMRNIVCKLPGASRRTVVFSGHYDTFSRPGLEFVGANDAGSSTGLLLTLAERLAKRKLADPVWIVFFDGEESVVQWKDLDHTYGSRRLAELWTANGMKTRIKALINVDMIGDADLNILYEGLSTPWLRDLIFDAAKRLGYEKQFPVKPPAYVADDHVEFVERGFPAVNLIDFEYGFFNRLWHSEADTLDKLSPRSFAIVLHVLDTVLEDLEARP